MIFVFLFLFLFMFFVAIIVSERHHMYYNDYDEDEYETTTTTTTVTNNYEVKGFLTRSFDNGQPFVIDPVDNDKVWLNTKDDMYEDGAGGIWELR